MDADLRRLLDIEEIKQLKARYFRGLDLKEWDAWGHVFTEDVHTEADGYPFDGRDTFIDAMREILADVRTVHHGFMPEITLTGHNEATGIWAMRDYLVFPSDGEPVGFIGYGHYHERYIRQDGGWRIRHLVLTRIGIDPLPGGLPSTLAN
jgi:SnoaL-like domain